MRNVKCAFSVCFQNFRKWSTDYRIWIIAILMLVMVQIYVDDIRKISCYLNTTVPLWIYPFLYSQFYNKIIFTIPLVFLFCNAPFIDNNQLFVIIRVTRLKWILGQILYIIISSAVFYVFLLFATLVLTLLSGNFDLDWGKALITIATNPSVASAAKAPFIEINLNVIKYFSPISALWFTFLMSWITGIIIGLIIFLLNIMVSSKTLGILTSSALLSITYIQKNNIGINLEEVIYISPISWNTLDNIDVGGFTSNPPFIYCISVCLTIILILVALIIVFGRKYNNFEV